MNCIKYISRLSNRLTEASGSVWAVIFSFLSTLVFLVIGLILHWSPTFLLVFNTFLSTLSYLILFILQHSSAKDTQSLHKKIDELIRALPQANNRFISIEKQDDDTRTNY